MNSRSHKADLTAAVTEALGVPVWTVPRVAVGDVNVIIIVFLPLPIVTGLANAIYVVVIVLIRARTTSISSVITLHRYFIRAFKIIYRSIVPSRDEVVAIPTIDPSLVCTIKRDGVISVFTVHPQLRGNCSDHDVVALPQPKLGPSAAVILLVPPVAEPRFAPVATKVDTIVVGRKLQGVILEVIEPTVVQLFEFPICSSDPGVVDVHANAVRPAAKNIGRNCHVTFGDRAPGAAAGLAASLDAYARPRVKP